MNHCRETVKIFLLDGSRNLRQSTFQETHATIQTFKYRQCRQISLFKNLFISKVLNVLGLKDSTELKETMQYYTNLPIFEHFGC